MYSPQHREQRTPSLALHEDRRPVRLSHHNLSIQKMKYSLPHLEGITLKEQKDSFFTDDVRVSLLQVLMLRLSETPVNNSKSAARKPTSGTMFRFTRPPQEFVLQHLRASSSKNKSLVSGSSSDICKNLPPGVITLMTSDIMDSAFKWPSLLSFSNASIVPVKKWFQSFRESCLSFCNKYVSLMKGLGCFWQR